MNETIRIRYLAAQEARRGYERNWRLNLAFIMGEQWVTYDKNYNKLQMVLLDKGKPRLTANLITPRMRLEFSALTDDPPSFKVECRDQLKAKKVYYYLQSVWDEYKYVASFREALLWAISCGTAYVKVYYDGNRGPFYPGGARGGDPIIDPVSPFELYVDPYARFLEESSWAIHDKVVPREYVKKKFGKDVGGSGVWMLYPSITSLRVKYELTRIPSTVVSEYWEIPSDEHPEGRFVVFSGNTVLYEGPNPYADILPIPFFRVRHTPLPGEFYAHTWVSDMRQVNVLYNRLRNDVLENSTKLSNPPLISPVGAITQDVKMEPGEIIKYNPLHLMGGKIDQLEITPYPTQVVNVLIRLEQEADEIAGVTAITRGGMPRGVRSAQQLFALQQTEEQRRQIVLAEYREMIAGALNGALKLARKFCSLPRKISGGNENIIFSGRDIPEDALAKVSVNLRKAPPSEQEQQFLLAMLDRKVIHDPRLLARVTKYASLEEAFADADLDTSQAQRENAKLAQGVPVEVEDWHNHMLHLIEHDRFRKSAEYEEQVPPQGKINVNLHCAKHKEFLQAAQMPQIPIKEESHGNAGSEQSQSGGPDQNGGGAGRPARPAVARQRAGGQPPGAGAGSRRTG